MDKKTKSPILVFAPCLVWIGMVMALQSISLASHSEARSLTLQEAVRMALQSSPYVLQAEARCARAAEVIRETRSLNRPQIYAGTGLAYNNGYPLSMEGAAPSIIQMGISQAVLSSKNNSLISEAEAASNATRYSAEFTRNQLAMRTAWAYLELYRARRSISLALAMLNSAQRQQELVEALLASGKVRPVDLTLARTNTSAARQQLLVAEETAKVAESELQELTGLQQVALLDLLEPRIDSPVFEQSVETLYQQALELSPEILQAESEIRAKEFRLKAEKGENLPQINIITQYAVFSRANNYADFFNRFTRNNFLIGLSFQVPLFNGSRTSARVTQSQLEVSEARYRLQQLKSELKMNIQRSLSALRMAQAKTEAARDDLEAAREMILINQALLEAGRISAKDMEECRFQMQQKELALLEADHALWQRKLELLSAVGKIASAIEGLQPAFSRKSGIP